MADEVTPKAMAALLCATALLRVGSAGTGIAIQFDLNDLAHGHPNGIIVGAIGATQALSEMVAAPILARYADRFGRKRFVVVGPLLGVIATLLLTIITLPREIAFPRLLEGIGAAAFIPTALGTIAAGTSTSRVLRAKASGAFEAATLFGYAGGFAIAPLAWHSFHRETFIILAALYLCATIVCSRFVPHIAPLPVTPLRRVLRILIEPGPVRSFMPAWFAIMALVGAFAANLPSLFRRAAVPSQTLVHGFDERLIGMFLVSWIVLLIAGISLWVPLIPRWGPARTMRRAISGAWLVCAGLLLMNHLDLQTSVIVLPIVVGGTLIQAGFGPAAIAYLAECSEAFTADRSSLMAFYTVSLAGGGAVGAILGGLASRWFLADGLFVLGLVLTTIAFFLLGPVVRHHTMHATPSAARL